MSSSGNPAPSSGQYPGNQRQPPGGRAWRSGYWQDPPRLSGRVLASGYGQGERYARFSGLPPRQDHPGASRAARLRRQPPGGPAAPGSCAGKPGSCAGKPGSCAGKPGSCAGQRSRSWPGSALTTTPGLNAAGHPARPRACWKASPAPCIRMRPSARTCSTLPAPPPSPPPCGHPRPRPWIGAPG